MTVALPIDAARAAAPALLAWRRHLAVLAAVAAAILALFHRDAAHLVSLWWNSSTYNHCLLIPPIIAWLVWQRRPELARTVPSLWWPGLLLVGGGASGWLLGDAGGVALARHAGLVLMLQGAVIACLGKAAARGLVFPIFYALFLVPAGEELVPPMQTLTAHMTDALLASAGIPAHLEGVFITTPTGYFEVAEACAGVKFLVAMVAYGALVANLCFRSWPRRIAFMAAAIVIPIVANGVRAYGTIHIAYLTSNDFAEGFDHLVYGGIFFAFVLALTMAVGWPFFDRKASDPWFDPEALQPTAPKPVASPRLAGLAAAAIAIAILPLLWSAAIASTGTRPAPEAIRFPDVPGWTRVAPERGRPWQPSFAGADVLRIARYRDAQGREVDLAIAVFARQAEGRELVGFGQGAAGPDSPWDWTGTGAPFPGGRSDLLHSNRVVREVASFYRVGDILTGSAGAVKIETMKTRLLGGPQRAVAVLVSSEAPGAGLAARPAIDSFLAALGPVEPLADRAAGIGR